MKKYLAFSIFFVITLGAFTSGFWFENELNIPLVNNKQKNKTEFFRHPEIHWRRVEPESRTQIFSYMYCFADEITECCGQGCESRRQTFSSITRPTFREI